jgi:uncharacterized SAM-binding protein YcdF (DUF218 family)
MIEAMAESANIEKEQPIRVRQVRKRLGFSWLGIQLLRAVIASVAMSVLGIALVAVLVLFQARRDETRPVDAVLVLPTVYDNSETVSRAADLYRRGYSRQLVISGAEGTALRGALSEQGLPAESMLGATGTTADWQTMTSLGRQRGVMTVLVVTERAMMLRDLKIARDQGFKAYAAPLSGPDLDFPTALQGSMAYWAYVLLGETATN